MLERWKYRARLLKLEVYTFYLAYKDPRVPWYARIFTVCVVAYAFSPIDLIPDPIPILGYIDDLILLPVGIDLALKMIPKEVIAEYREQAKVIMLKGNPVNRVAAVVVVGIWMVLAILAVVIVSKYSTAK